MHDRRPSHGHFVCLDGLRGVAACLVLLGHVTGLMQQANDTWVPRKYLAVQFFFRLSEFVLAYAYKGRIRRGMRVLEFYKTRAIRLYPLVILAAAAQRRPPNSFLPRSTICALSQSLTRPSAKSMRPRSISALRDASS